ncbi:MAG TPA: hypothetical protein VIV06_00590 [Candidatus Limnocylindrales bacterium]
MHHPTRFERDKGTVNDREAIGVDEEVEDRLGRPRDLDVMSDLHVSRPVQRAEGKATQIQA